MCTIASDPLGGATVGLALAGGVPFVAAILAWRRPHHATRVAAFALACVGAVASLFALAPFLAAARPSLATRALLALPPGLLASAAVWGYAVWRPERRMLMVALALSAACLLLAAAGVLGAAPQAMCAG